MYQIYVFYIYTMLYVSFICFLEFFLKCDVGDLGSIPSWEDPLEKGKANPLQYSGLYSPWGHKVTGLG